MLFWYLGCYCTALGPGPVFFPPSFILTIKKIQKTSGTQGKSCTSPPVPLGLWLQCSILGWVGAGVHDVRCVTLGRLLINSHSFWKRVVTVSNSKNVQNSSSCGPLLLEGWQLLSDLHTSSALQDAQSWSQQTLPGYPGRGGLESCSVPAPEGIWGPPPGVSSLTAHPCCPQTLCVTSFAAQ